MIRLDKFLADAGIGTRSEVKKYLKKGQVTLNGEPVLRPEIKINPDRDLVCFDGKPVCYEKFSYYLYHKPAGRVTARRDISERTVMDDFPESFRNTFSPVGRLDKDTEGLLLVTNDGALSHRLLSPAYHVEKTYFATLDQPVPTEAVELFACGIDIGDEKLTLPAELVILPVTKKQYSAELTIREGRFHQVKRMFEAVGCKVLYLKRLSFGGLTLDDLSVGSYRRLTDAEVELLRKKADKKNRK